MYMNLHHDHFFSFHRYLTNSLMLVTVLNQHIGYDKAAEIAKLAYNEDLTLKEAALKKGYLSEEEFDKWVRPELMLGPDASIAQVQ